MATPGYSRFQIILHWSIALLMILQVLLADGMEHVTRALARGFDPQAADLILAQFHIWAGITIFVLAVPRLILRWRLGAPKTPSDEPALVRLIGQATHVVLYLAIFLMPISGAVAWFGKVELVGEAHAAVAGLVQIFIGLHIVGAIYQHFVVKSDVLRRMVRPL